MKHGLRKFCSAAIITLTLVVTIDKGIGLLLEQLLPYISVKEVCGKTEYTLNGVNSPILIVGSSRAYHHYDSRIITNILGKEAYNTGLGGHFFTHNCCIINSILERYTPDIIIWEIDPTYITNWTDSGLPSLYPYYGEKNYITKTLNETLEWDERLKLTSDIYKYNSSLIHIAAGLLQNKAEQFWGYHPLPPKTLLDPLKLKERPIDNKDINCKKLERFKSTLANAKSKGTQLILTRTPIYGIIVDNTLSDMIKNMCDSIGVTYIDNAFIYTKHPEYFNDQLHLNEIGAKHYTTYFANTLKNNI